MSTKNKSSLLPIISCLIAATLWGVLWYPLRVLEGMGIPGLWATLIIYLSALVPMWPLIWKQRHGLRSQCLLFVLIGIFAGWTNLAFILAMLEGHSALFPLPTQFPDQFHPPEVLIRFYSHQSPIVKLWSRAQL